MLEQVMRVTSDDLLAIPFASCRPASPEFFTAIGRLLSDTPGPIPPGSPLHRWSQPVPCSPAATWRDGCPPSQMSLWGELTALRVICRPSTQPDPFSELLALRAST